MGTAIATALAVFGVATSATVEHMARLFSLTAAALFLCAGVLRLARWRILAEPRCLLTGTALVVLGAISVPSTVLAGILTRGDANSALRAATAIATTFVVILLVVRALAVAPDQPLRSKTVLLGSCLTAAGLAGLMLIAHGLMPQLLDIGAVNPLLMRGAVLAAAWLSLAYRAAVVSEEHAWAGQLTPLLACMFVSEVLRLNQVFLVGGWALSCVVLMLMVSALTAHRALLELDEATKWEHAELAVVSAALSESQAGIDAHHAWREELTHDARNALAGLRAALHTLERYEASLDAPTLERLRSAAIGEVGHLEDMIIRNAERKPVDFDIAQAIRSTIETRRAAGLEVEVHDFSWTAHGHPGDLATVVQNILVNTQRHAPGSKARVCVVPAGQKVHLYIADDGPGLTDEQAVRVFERGSRGPDSDGSGLGLFVARSLMRKQGGDVELRGHLEGAVFVVTLPAAKGPTYAAEVELPQQRLPHAGAYEPLGVSS